MYTMYDTGMKTSLSKQNVTDGLTPGLYVVQHGGSRLQVYLNAHPSLLEAVDANETI